MIPSYQDFMLPLLRLMADGQERKLSEVITPLADQFELSTEERKALLESGQQTILENRIGWAKTYLKQAGLLEITRRGWFRISDAGRELLAKAPPRIDLNLLNQFPEFRAFRARSRPEAKRGLPSDENATSVAELSSSVSPAEALSAAYRQLRDEVESELLALVRKASPRFFEQLVVDLMLAMGYGGSRQEAGRAIGQSGDGGIDGVINEDRLGLDKIYLQAKRWDGTVGRPEIQKFAGALQGQRASKGVFITTSSFTKDAIEYARSISSTIILIDGETLAALMYDHGVGVARDLVYEIKRIDGDYFEAA
ncbi:MAG: restriction endonuclease [Casimicrobiaceae bacterium]|nr:restriction endonuclease [Casimicrobiaceae bacterium]MDW8312494.1 restriction endonuclease [Burkholderiales bacterium]